MSTLQKIRIALWGAAILAVIIYVGYSQYKIDEVKQSMEIVSDTIPEATRNDNFMPVAGLKPVKPFALINHHGEEFTEEFPIWKDNYRLIYFGFTSCPSICPGELHKMTTALKQLSDEEKKDIQPFFITVDPERDMPDTLKNYLSLFDPEFIGLTGTQENIQSMMDDWGVFAQKVNDDSLSDYTVDHSSIIYFQAPSGDILRLFRMHDSAETVANFLKSYVAQNAQK